MVEIAEARSQEELDAAAKHNNKDIAERMETDPRFAAIKKQLMDTWSGPDKRDILSEQGQNFVFGNPAEARAGKAQQTLDDKAAVLFKEQFPAEAKRYAEAEKIRVYEDPSKDPAVRAVEERITRQTTLDTQADERSGAYRTDSHRDLYDRNLGRISRSEWESFVREYPEKAAGYRGRKDEIDRVFRAEERERQYQEEQKRARDEFEQWKRDWDAKMAAIDARYADLNAKYPLKEEKATEDKPNTSPVEVSPDTDEAEKEDAEDSPTLTTGTQTVPVQAAATVTSEEQQQEEDAQGIAAAKEQIDTLPSPAIPVENSVDETVPSGETTEINEPVPSQRVETQANPEKTVEQQYSELRGEWLTALVDIVPAAEDFYSKQMLAHREQRAGNRVSTPELPLAGQTKMRRVSEARDKMNQFFQEHPDYANTVNERLKENDEKLKKLAARYMYVRFGPEVLALSPLARDADVTGLREGNEDQLRQISQEIQTLKDDPDYKVRELAKYLREPSKKYADRLEEERKEALERSRIN